MLLLNLLITFVFIHNNLHNTMNQMQECGKIPGLSLLTPISSLSLVTMVGIRGHIHLVAVLAPFVVVHATWPTFGDSACTF